MLDTSPADDLLAEPHGLQPPRRYRRWLSYVLLIGACFAVYANSLHNEWQYDDFHNVVQNPSVMDLGNLHKFFFQPHLWSVDGQPGGSNAYRPLAMATFALNYALHEYELPGYHLVSIALHAACTILVFLILLRLLTGHLAVAFCASLLFAVQPINSQAVNYLSSRSALLATLFYWAAFLLYLECRVPAAGSRKKAVYFASALICYILSICSKESGFTLPAVLLVCECFLPSDTPRRWRSILLRLLPFFLLAGAYLLLRYFFFGYTIQGHRPDPFAIGVTGKSHYTNLLVQSGVVPFYLKLILLPTNLSVDRYVEVPTAINLKVVLQVNLLLALGLACWFARHRQPLLIFALLWFLITIAPETLLPLNVHVNEHRLYLAGLAWVIAAALLLKRIGFHRPVAKGGAALVVVCLSLLTWERNRDWRDELTFWTHELEVSRGNYRTVANFSNILASAGRLEEAIRKLDGNLYRFLHEPSVRYLSAILHSRAGNVERAIREYRAAIKLNPANADIFFAFAELLRAEDRLEDAVAVLRTLLIVAPDNLQAQNELGVMLLDLNRVAEAQAAFQKALALDNKRAEIHYNLGLCAHYFGDDEAAQAHWRDAMERDPDYVDAIKDLEAIRLETMEEKLARAKEMALLGRVAGAQRVVQLVLRKEPESVPARSLLAFVLLEQGKLDEAETVLAEALELSPESPDLLTNVGILRHRRGAIEGALGAFGEALAKAPRYDFARYRRGLALLDAGRAAEALPDLRRFVDANPGTSDARYNLACALALAGESEAALDELERSVDLGLIEIDDLAADEDLTALRDHPRFQQLNARLRETKTSIPLLSTSGS